MLTTLRQHSRSTIIYVLFGIIIAAFILTFNTAGPTKGCGGVETIVMAEVNGVSIDSDILRMGIALSVDPPEPGKFSQQSLQRLEAYETTRFLRGNPDYRYMALSMPDREEISPLKARRVMDDLVETYLTSGIALSQGFRVTDDELAERVYENPWFRDYWYDEDEKFQKRGFTNFIQYSLGTSPVRFEDFLRRELLREKLIRHISDQVQVTDAEVEYEWKLANDKVNLRFAEFDGQVVKLTASVAKAEIDKAVAERKDAIAAYYEKNKKRYQKEERAEVHGIFVQAPLQSRIDRTEDEAEKKKLQTERAAAKKKADDALASLLKKAPVAPPAPAADGTPAPAPAPVDPKAVDVAKFEELAKTTSQHLGTKDAGGAFGELKPRSSFAIWPFGKGVDEAVFGLKIGQVSGVLEVPNGYWIVRLDKKVAAETRTLKQVEREIARILVLEDAADDKAKALAEAFQKQVAADAKKSLDEHVAAWNKANPIAPNVTVEDGMTSALVVRETGAFALTSQMPGAPWGIVPMIGKNEELARAAFTLTEAAPVAAKVFTTTGPRTRHLVVQLAEQVPADATVEGVDDDKKAIRARLVRERQRQHYRAWYTNTLTAAKTDGDVTETDEFLSLIDAEARQQQEALEKMQKAGGGLPGAGGAPIKVNVQ